MILYGEDRITPAKKVAIALAEFITTRYPKDTLDILVLGTMLDPYPLKNYHICKWALPHNTVAGLALAMDAPKKEYKQTNLHDHRRKTQLP